jgi:two-component system alkaline phosphatase synthesis response regulator PhoP
VTKNSATTAQILEKVWGRLVEPTVVDTFIWHLRQKLEPNPQAPVYFVGIRGLGYRFDANGAVTSKGV